LNYKLLPDVSVFVKIVFESIFIEVNVEDKNKYIIGSAYRPGTQDPVLFLNEQFAQFCDLFCNLAKFN
jgi:hypothetical protein